jgi:hypothetical protein
VTIGTLVWLPTVVSETSGSHPLSSPVQFSVLLLLLSSSPLRKIWRISFGRNWQTKLVFLKSYHPIPRRDSTSRPIAPVSSVAGGDNTTRQHHQGFTEENFIRVKYKCTKIALLCSSFRSCLILYTFELCPYSDIIFLSLVFLDKILFTNRELNFSDETEMYLIDTYIVPFLPKVIHNGFKIFVTYTVYILFTDVFWQDKFESIVKLNLAYIHTNTYKKVGFIFHKCVRTFTHICKKILDVTMCKIGKIVFGRILTWTQSYQTRFSQFYTSL